jgi:pentatricopeptide repeat protein
MICGGFSLLEPGEVYSQPFRLAQQMVCQGMMPSPVTYAALFTTCSNTLAQDDGVRLHSRISGTSIEADTVVGNAIIHMYGKCGALKEAKLAFLRIRKRSLITWNAMIGAFCQHGHVQDVLGILKEMQMDGIAPDEVTYFNVFSVCSHCGVVDQGFQHFFFMCYNHNIIPCIEHFNCLIGLLGRAGRLDEGEEIIRNMPFTKILNSLMPLLIACCNIHSDSIRGKRLADLAFQLEPDSAASYVTLANVYAMGD